MYPNTIEPIRRQKANRFSSSNERSFISWLSRYMFFLCLSALTLLPNFLSARAITNPSLVNAHSEPDRTDALAQQSGILIPAATTDIAERHPLERLRQTLWQNLLTDGLLNNASATAILSMPADVERINGQAIPYELQHKYNAIIFAYGIETGEGIEIRLSTDFIMVGSFDANGILLHGEVRGTNAMVLTSKQ